jgi:hypothetical protein
MFSEYFNCTNVFTLSCFALESPASQTEVHAVAGPKIRVYYVGPALVHLTDDFVEVSGSNPNIQKKINHVTVQANLFL